MTRTADRRSISHDPFLIAQERRTAAAWRDYLEATRDAPRQKYLELEQAAWARLQRRLERLDMRSRATRGTPLEAKSDG